MLNKSWQYSVDNGASMSGSSVDVTQGTANGDQEPVQVIRVLLADDHALVREGTRRLLETESDVEVVAEAASGEEAVAAAQRLHPDIAIMDIAMPGMGGIEATRAIKGCCPETAVLVL
jgi:CheY-like chemotaxis protein